MAKDIVCPVCKKHGIPDYHKADVICPCCGSDLSIYRVVDQIPGNGKKMVWMVSAIAAAIAVIVLSVTLARNPNSDYTEKYSQMNDSIAILNQKISEVSALNISDSEVGFPYVVRKGDSFWKISLRLYGTGTQATKIAEMNNLSLQDVLHTGDTLFIK